MIKERIRPTTQNYTIKLPKEYLNKDIVIQVSPVMPSDGENYEHIDIIRKTSGMLAQKNIDPIEWQKKIRTEITTLSYSDKIYLLQLLVQEIAKEESLNVKSEKHGQYAAEILRRMADRKALGSISEPVEWQREIRQDNVLDGRE